MRSLIEERIRTLLEEVELGTVRLREKDEEFLQSCIDRYGGPDTELSDAQEAWVNDLYEKHIVKSCPHCG